MRSGQLTRPRRRLVIGGLLALALLGVGAFVLVEASGVQQLWDQAKQVGPCARKLVEQAGPWAPLIYVALKAAIFIVVPFAGPPLEVASGALFGIFWGITLTALGTTVGGCLLYGLSWFLGRPAVAKLVGENGIARMDWLLDRGLGSWRELLFFRVVVPVPYNLVSLAAGLAKTLPFRDFMIVTFLTATLPNIFTVGAGAGLVADRWMQIALYGGLVVIGVGALLLRRRVLEILVAALRLKPEAENRPQGQNAHHPEANRDRRTTPHSRQEDNS